MSGKGWWNNAISGLESRLDTILTEDGQGKPVDSGSAGGAGSVNGVGGVSNTRNSSRSRPNSRLQDRLAKAVAVNKGTGVGTGTGNGERPDEEAISASVSVSASPRPSLDIQQPTSIPTPSMSIPSIVTPQPASPQHSVDSNLSRPSMDMDKDTGKDTSTPAGPDDTSEPSTRDPDLLLAELSALQEAHEQTIRGHHDELNAHLERIDALQSKLTYLAQQLTTSAKATTDDTDTTPADRKLAEKDMRISSLMEEGQRLSKTEMKHLTTVKTLRAKALDHNKDIATLKQRLSKAEKSITEQSERAKRAEAADRAAQEKLKILAKIETDLQLIQEEREEAGMTIAELRKQLSDALSRAETAEQRVQTGALEAEKRVTASLKEDLENLRIEKKLAEDRAKREIQNSKDEAKSQEERAKIVELELRGEIINLESKLELLRSRTEEATSSVTGDSQAKLLRQIETLQSQYSLASENWHGIETNLNSRIAALEKDRDETAKRESDVRRKARDVNSKARRLEDELENVSEQARTLDHDLTGQRAAMQKMQVRCTQAETTAQDTRAELEREKKVWEAEFQQRLEEEKGKWKLEMSQQPSVSDANHLRADSPSDPRRRHSPDPLGIYNRRSMPRPVSSGIDMAMPLSPMDRMFDDAIRRPSNSRHRSTPKVRTPELGTPQRQDSIASLTNINGANIPDTPSIHTMDYDEPFENVSSPQMTINDMISASTAGAGPSVQLVERMSAAVRRLESEKATSKEELARLGAQRDEAREEVVKLMREVEEKRNLNQKVDALEKDLKEMEQRYDTTLELLGEKTEKVEELEGDVADLKKIYRELVQTMK